MKPDARLDALVATALREKLPAPTPEATHRALDRVLDRSPRTRPVRLWAAAAAVAAVVAGLLFVAPLPWGDDTSERLPAGPVSASAPEELLSTWTRTVRVAADPAAEGTWTMALSRSGVLTLDAPPGVDGLDGTSFVVRGTLLTTDAFVNGACPDLPTGSYRWAVEADVLRLERAGDSCAFRLSVLGGEWRRAGP